jgi:hypothetical protein
MPARNTLGTAGLVCGLIACACWLIPRSGTLMIPVAITGIVLSTKGMGVPVRRWTAIAGLITSITSLVSMFVLVFVLAAVMMHP